MKKIPVLAAAMLLAFALAFTGCGNCSNDGNCYIRADGGALGLGTIPSGANCDNARCEQHLSNASVQWLNQMAAAALAGNPVPPLDVRCNC